MNTNMPLPKRYSGVVVPMVTPFTADGELDEPAVRRVIDHLVAGGVAGVFVLGTTGEEASMSPTLRLRLVKVTAEHIAGRAMIYAGISDNCLATSVTAARDYMCAGAEVLVARLPTYYALDAAEQRAYFSTLADQVPGPLMLYNITATTHLTIPLDVVLALSEHRNILGVKDSDNNPARLRMLIEAAAGRSDFSVFVGVTTLSALMLATGADGLVPSPANLVPNACQRLYEQAISGETAAADKTQREIDELSVLLRGDRSLGRSLGMLKAAMGALSLCDPYVLPPLLPPTAVEAEAIRLACLDWQIRSQILFSVKTRADA